MKTPSRRELLRTGSRLATAAGSAQAQGQQVGVKAAKPWAEIHIDDSGAGIPVESLARVFDPFVRLEDSRSTDTGGNGLGLTIARAIALRHGGDLALANRSEGGLRATLRLPLI